MNRPVGTAWRGAGLTQATLGKLLREGRERLEGRSDSPGLDAEILLAWAVDGTRASLRAFPERPVNARRQARFRAALARRAAGAPVAYLTGVREFWSLSLQVSPATLVPRPETECLVELALEALPQPDAAVADLGTGCGAVALALARERPRWRLVATDNSVAALRVARANARRLGVASLALVAGDWCTALRPGPRFDAIVSNPPYVAAGDPHLGRLAAEPRQALVAGSDGLAAIRDIVAQAGVHLLPGGLLALEHAPAQATMVRDLMRHAGFSRVHTRADYAGRARITAGYVSHTGAP